MIRKQQGGILVELNPVELSNTELVGALSIEELPTEIRVVLSQYNAFFDIPHGLPPKWGREHHIVTKEGSDPVSVRPYRYPQIQKAEIKKMVEDMLLAGII